MKKGLVYLIIKEFSILLAIFLIMPYLFAGEVDKFLIQSDVIKDRGIELLLSGDKEAAERCFEEARALLERAAALSIKKGTLKRDFSEGFDSKENVSENAADVERFQDETQMPVSNKAEAHTKEIENALTSSAAATSGQGPETATEVYQLPSFGETGGNPIRLRVFLNEPFYIKAAGIKRFLSQDNTALGLSRLADNILLAEPKSAAQVVAYVWTDAGMYTLFFEIIPKEFIRAEKEKKRLINGMRPFTLSYDFTYGASYSGRRLENADRTTLSRGHRVSFEGDSPYGVWDGYLFWNYRDNNYFLDSYSLGLTGGRWGNFEDFDLRLFDFSESFSDLSYSGGNLYGFWMQSWAFDKRFKYELLYGQEKQIYYSFFDVGKIGRRDNYVQGVRFEFYPRDGILFALNALRGYGDDRDEFLPENVYSLQMEWQASNALSHSFEIASDNNAFAGKWASRYLFNENEYATLELRDIEGDFSSISGKTGGTGELGAKLSYYGRLWENGSVSYDLDIFRDRVYYYAPQKRDWNIRWQAQMENAIDDLSRVSAYLYLFYEPQLSLPRKETYGFLSYSRDFSIFSARDLLGSLSYSYRETSNKTTPVLNYNAHTVSASLRLLINSSFSAYTRYTISSLDEQQENSYPNVWESGLEYNKDLAPNSNLWLTFYYRNEEETEGINSFLVGEDSIELSGRFSHTLRDGIEYYIDGRLKRAWKEGGNGRNIWEADIYTGLSIDWDTPFVWQASAQVTGRVYVDENGNGVYDNTEKVFPNISVLVNGLEAKTDANGIYTAGASGKEVIAELKTDGLPSGYFSQNGFVQKRQITQGKQIRIDFPLVVNTVFEGIVFIDGNNNSRYDQGEAKVSNVKLYLDEKVVATDSKGYFLFEGLSEGVHRLRIDINSLPFGYIPNTPVEMQIDIKRGENEYRYISLRKQ